MTGTLQERISASLAAPVADEVRRFAARLGQENDALAVLFYGSNLRTGLLEGVLDYYVLLPGEPEPGIWPRVHGRRPAPARKRLQSYSPAATLKDVPGEVPGPGAKEALGQRRGGPGGDRPPRMFPKGGTE